MAKKINPDDFIEMDNKIIYGKCPKCGEVYNNCDEDDICPDCDEELEIVALVDDSMCEVCGNEIEKEETYYQHISDKGKILCSDCYSTLAFDADDDEDEE